MRRMLDPKEAGGLPSSIEFDKEGNRKVSKDLGVDGKLKLKSLVSNTNPDGDITKELGGGDKLYRHYLTINGKYSVKAYATLNYYSYKKEEFTIQTFGQTFLNDVSVCGYFLKDNKYYIAVGLSHSTGTFNLYGNNLTDGSYASLDIDGSFNLSDRTPQQVK